MTTDNSAASSKKINITDRLVILEKLEAGVSVKDVAREFGVTERSIRRHRQSALSIRQFAEGDTKNLERKRIRTSIFDELNKELYNWFLQRRLLGDKITDNILLEKAKELQEEIGGPSNFAASRGWLWRFKKNYNLRLVNNHGESADADMIAAEKFTKEFPRLLEENGITDDYLYNMNETSLFWKMLPSNTLISTKEERVEGRKMKKDRITLGFCANASGNHKLPLLFVHRYENPRALKHCKKNLPVTYAYHKNAWVNNAIFRWWYEDVFKPQVRKRQLEENRTDKVLLLLDNFSGHKLSQEEMDDGHFKIMFLPPNTSSLIQPMDQGVIAKCKKLFRQSLLQRALHYNNGILLLDNFNDHKLSQEEMDDSYFKMMFLPPNTPFLIQSMDQDVIAKCKKLFRQSLLQRALHYNNGIAEFYADYDIKDCIDLIHKSWTNITATNIFNSWNKVFKREIRQPLAQNISASYETVSDEEVAEWMNECEEEEAIGEEDTEEEYSESQQSSIEEEEIDRLLHDLKKIMITDPQIEDHAEAIIHYFNTK